MRLCLYLWHNSDKLKAALFQILHMPRGAGWLEDGVLFKIGGK